MKISHQAASGMRASTMHWSLCWASRSPNPVRSAFELGCNLPGGPSHVDGFIDGSVGGPMCGLGWKSLGVLELTALPSIKEEYSVSAVEEMTYYSFWAAVPVSCYLDAGSPSPTSCRRCGPTGLRRHEWRCDGRDSRLRRSKTYQRQ